MAVGDHQRALLQALIDDGIQATSTPASLRMNMLPLDGQAKVMEVYRALGGTQDQPALTPNGWDCPLADGLIVELDELQHFNRYRATTLELDWALQLPWRTDYLTQCAAHEADCLRNKASSNFWSTPKAELMFGSPAPSAKSLEGVGSPRWKQRALYDAMRDIAAQSGVVKLARVSIFDLVGAAPLGLALDGGAHLDLNALQGLVARRTVAVI